jgi:phosphate:Na+ symporter
MLLENISLISILGLLGGAAILLFGLDMMSGNLSKAAGNTLKLVLEKATDNAYIGLFIGTLVTGIVNSSSATTSILVSLVQSKLMTFERSLAVMLGANIGSTVTGQIMAFDVTKWSMAIIFTGFMIRTFAQRSRTKYFAMIVMGLGFIFLGLDYMSASMKSFRNSEYFIELMTNCQNVWFGIFVGAVFTAIIHSSGAFTGITIGLAMQGLITLEAALPLILGSNIGTCVTAWIASIGSGASARRVAMSHILYNIIGVLLFAFWVPGFVDLVKFFTPDQSDIPRLVANAQTYFNVASAVIFMPCLKGLEWLTKLCVPDDKEGEMVKYTFPRVSNLADSPDLLFIHSVDGIRAYKNTVKEMLWLSRDYFIKKEKEKLTQLIKLREYQQEFRSDILDFLSRIGKLRLAYKDVARVINHVSLVNEIEHVAYKLEASIDTLKSQPNFEDKSYEGLEDYFKQTVKCFSKACNAVLNDSEGEAHRIEEHLDSLRLIEEQLRNKSVQLLHDDVEYEDEKQNLWVLEFIRSVNATSRRIAHIMVDKRKAKIRALAGS